MKKFLIHLLGGFTMAECAALRQQAYDEGCLDAIKMFKRFADQMNGLPADDWCKMMYNHICGYIKRLENEETTTLHQEQ